MAAPFEQLVVEQVKKLQTQKYPDIERSVTQKRIDWVKKNYDCANNEIAPR